MKSCFQCDHNFIQKRSWQKFCNHHCQEVAARKRRLILCACPSCGKLKHRSPSRINNFCVDCRHKKRVPVKIRFNDKKHEAMRAQQSLARARYAGKIPNATKLRCIDCGKIAAEYDHHKGYKPRFALTVQPVCRSCHSKRKYKRGEWKPLRLRGNKNGRWKDGISNQKRLHRA